MTATAEIVGAAKSAAVMPLGYVGYREVRMNPDQYAQLATDLKTEGFGMLCGLPVVVGEQEHVEIVSVLGESPYAEPDNVD